MNDAHEPDEARHLRLQAEKLDITRERETYDFASVRTDVVETPVARRVAYVTETLDVRTVDASPGARRADPIVEPQRLAIRLSREKIVLRKRTVAAEEITIGRRAETDVVRVSATLRHEDLVIERDTRRESR